MPSLITPFSRTELLPQEEKLEVGRRRGDLFIGIPKEHSFQEKRVCLTPDAVTNLTANGHRVLIEQHAGKDAGFSDRDYAEAGAEITDSTKKVFGCPLILKVEPPTEEELDYMNPQTILFSALQIKTQKKEYFEKLIEKHITGLAFEHIRNKEGIFPIVTALSEIAGTASILIASDLLASPGKGLIFGNIAGVPPLNLVIIGAGTVGRFAAQTALGLGINPKVFDQSLTKLRELQKFLQHPVYTSTLQPNTLLKALKRADVVIGAVYGKERTPVVISETMVGNMKPGAIIVDVSIDMGGCVETSEVTTHEHPVFTKYGVVHYGVPNLPSRYPRSASICLSNILVTSLLHIGEEGGLENTLRFDRGLRNGLYSYHGVLTNKSVAEWFNLDYRDINLLIF